MNDIIIDIDLAETDKQISIQLQKYIIEVLHEAFQRATPAINDKIKSQTRVFFVDDTYYSLAYGALAANFGFPQGAGQAQVDMILATIINNIQVTYQPLKKSGSSIIGGLSLGVLVADFSDILTLDAAVITTEKQVKLPWLEWLLIRGNQLIIDEYSVDLAPGRGRSGQAVMIHDSGHWKVPSKYAGTINNNWLTRSISDHLTKYMQMVRSTIYNEISKNI